MSSLKKQREEAKARMEGMMYAYKIITEAKEKGEDMQQALKTEINFRGVSSVPIPYPKELAQERIGQISDTIQNVLSVMSIYTLIKDFYFGKLQCNRFEQDFKTNCDMLDNDMLNWEDILNKIAKETGLNLKIEHEGW